MLVVGSGGREHSLIWRLAQSEMCQHVFAAPGNPGIALEPNVTNVALDVTKHHEVGHLSMQHAQPCSMPLKTHCVQVVRFCQQKGVHLVIVGPEVPLVAGLADDLEAAGIPTWGPSAKAAQLEGSKSFMKVRAGGSSARGRQH